MADDFVEPELDDTEIVEETIDPEPAEENEEPLEPMYAAWLDEPEEPTSAPPAPPQRAPTPQYAQPQPYGQSPSVRFDAEAFARNPDAYLGAYINASAREQANEIISRALPEALGPVANQLGNLQAASMADGARLVGDIKRHIHKAYESDLSNDNSFRAKGRVHDFVKDRMQYDYQEAVNAHRAGDYQRLAYTTEMVTNPKYAKAVLALAKIMGDDEGIPQAINPGRAQTESSKQTPKKGRPKIDADTRAALKRWGKSEDEYIKSLESIGSMYEG